MKNLEEKILKNFKNSIAMSNFKEEFEMKKLLKKQIVTTFILVVILFSGGFLTVNASTNGKLVEDIKNKIYTILKNNEDINIDNNTVEIQNIEKDKDGNTEVITYTF